MRADGLAGQSRRGFINAGVGAASLAGSTAACSGGSGRAGSPRAGRASAGGELTEAVLAAFRTHRLVGIGEVHNLQQHHDLLETLVVDPRLPDVVDDIVVEFGNARYQDTMDRFIAGQVVGDVDLRQAWRNTSQSPVQTWDQPVYEQFFRSVRAANWGLPAGKRMRVLLGDPPLDWSKITTLSQLEAVLAQGDTYPASLIERQVLAKGRRALLCYGMAHLLRHPASRSHLPPNLVSIIEQRTGERTYTIADLVPLADDPGGLAAKLSRYPRNTVIPAKGTWLGSFNAGLVAQVLIAGKPGQLVNPYCGLPLRSVIDDGLYEGQPADLTASCWNPAIYLDPVYWHELQRRNALRGDPVKLDSYRQEQPARFPLKKLPRSAECGHGAAAH